jgi:hypothetical protein
MCKMITKFIIEKSRRMNGSEENCAAKFLSTGGVFEIKFSLRGIKTLQRNISLKEELSKLCMTY